MISVERQYQNTIDELTADIANLRAGHCLAVIPETLVDCGEGGNYCSEACRLRALNALAQELETKRVTMLDANRAEIVRLDTLVADMRSAGDETLAARERDHAERALEVRLRSELGKAPTQQLELAVNAGVRGPYPVQSQPCRSCRRWNYHLVTCSEKTT